MKATGIVRKLDNLGRIVLPIELRNVLSIQPGDSMEIFTDDGNIILRKYAPGCVLCGNTKNTELFAGKLICRECLDALKGMKNP